MCMQDVLSWDHYFMAQALLAGKRSKDPNTQVGACIVDHKRHVVGVGYNGMPNGNDTDFSWERDGKWIDTKYPYVVHAELNAILNSVQSLQDSTIYVSLFPCQECAKAIVQAGIHEVCYLSDKYAGTEGNTASKRILEYSNVQLRKIDMQEPVILHP